MSYTPAVPFGFELEGEQFTCALRRISRGDFARLQPFFQTNDDGDSTFAFGDANSYALMDEAEQILPKYVDDWDGPAPLTSVTSEMALMSVFAALFGKLITTANMTASEVKNSEAPPIKSTAARDTGQPKRSSAGSRSSSGSEPSKPAVAAGAEDIPSYCGQTVEAT